MQRLGRDGKRTEQNTSGGRPAREPMNGMGGMGGGSAPGPNPAGTVAGTTRDGGVRIAFATDADPSVDGAGRRYRRTRIEAGGIVNRCAAYERDDAAIATISLRGEGGGTVRLRLTVPLAPGGEPIAALASSRLLEDAGAVGGCEAGGGGAAAKAAARAARKAARGAAAQAEADARLAASARAKAARRAARIAAADRRAIRAAEARRLLEQEEREAADAAARLSAARAARAAASAIADVLRSAQDPLADRRGLRAALKAVKVEANKALHPDATGSQAGLEALKEVNRLLDQAMATLGQGR